MRKLLLFLTGLSGYIHIILFPVLISLIISLVAYINMPDLLGVAVSLFLIICGLITGLVMALRVLRKRGPAAFVPTEEMFEAEADTQQEQEDFKQL